MVNEHTFSKIWPSNDKTSFGTEVIKNLAQSYMEFPTKTLSDKIRHNRQNDAKELLEFAETKEGATAHECAMKLINVIEKSKNTTGWLNEHIIAVLNKALNADYKVFQYEKPHKIQYPPDYLASLYKDKLKQHHYSNNDVTTEAPRPFEKFGKNGSPSSEKSSNFSLE